MAAPIGKMVNGVWVRPSSIVSGVPVYDTPGVAAANGSLVGYTAPKLNIVGGPLMGGTPSAGLVAKIANQHAKDMLSANTETLLNPNASAAAKAAARRDLLAGTGSGAATPPVVWNKKKPVASTAPTTAPAATTGTTGTSASGFPQAPTGTSTAATPATTASTASPTTSDGT